MLLLLLLLASAMLDVLAALRCRKAWIARHGGVSARAACAPTTGCAA